MSSEPPIPNLAVEQLHLRRGGQTVLEDITFQLRSGECAAVVGPNGAGKTSLMLALMGWLPPHHGRVLLDGRDLAAIDDRRAVARRIAHVPQQYEGFTGFTVFDMVASGRYAHRRPFELHDAEDRRLIDQALSTCGLAGLEQRVVATLSGGERQKVWLAAAIAQQSPILLLDEPTTALDPRHQTELLELLRQQHRAGKTVVIICHDLNLAVALRARILALRDGRLLFDVAVERFLDPEHLRQVYGTEFDILHTPDGRLRVYPREGLHS